MYVSLRAGWSRIHNSNNISKIIDDDDGNNKNNIVK
jgi:hypothetical protein